jgi:transcriptional regulator with XRE-family HTH domain
MVTKQIKNLILIREEAGVSRFRLSKIAGLAHQTVIDFEEGKNRRRGSITEKKLREAYENIKERSSAHALLGESKNILPCEWLQNQIDSFLKQNAAGFYEKNNLRWPVLTEKQIYQLCRLVLLAGGIKVD